MLKGILAFVFGVVSPRTGWILGENGTWKIRALKIKKFPINSAPASHPTPPDGTEFDIKPSRPCRLFLSSLSLEGLMDI